MISQNRNKGPLRNEYYYMKWMQTIGIKPSIFLFEKKKNKNKNT